MLSEEAAACRAEAAAAAIAAAESEAAVSSLQEKLLITEQARARMHACAYACESVCAQMCVYTYTSRACYVIPCRCAGRHAWPPHDRRVAAGAAGC